MADIYPARFRVEPTSLDLVRIAVEKGDGSDGRFFFVIDMRRPQARQLATDILRVTGPETTHVG